MSAATLFPNAPDISADDYCIFGLATCFVKEDGEVWEVEIIEPIPSSYLEALLKGVPTAYKFVCAQSLKDVFGKEQLQKPARFPETAQFCSDFAIRSVAAARTYKRNRDAQTYIRLGTVREDFNYSLERKRVLNADRLVTAEDNVKQHAYTHQVL